MRRGLGARRNDLVLNVGRGYGLSIATGKHGETLLVAAPSCNNPVCAFQLVIEDVASGQWGWRKKWETTGFHLPSTCIQVPGAITAMTAITDACGFPAVLFTDFYEGAVHILELADGSRRGHVAPPSTLPAVSGIATFGSLAACTARSSIVLFDCECREKDTSLQFQWTRRASVLIDGLDFPTGLKFTLDGAAIVVACRDGIYKYGVMDGDICCRVGPRMILPIDLVADSDGAWLVACVEQRDWYIHEALGIEECAMFVLGAMPAGVAWSNTLGLIVRTDNGDVRVVTTLDMEVMDRRTSSARLAWMCGVVRGAAFCK